MALDERDHAILQVLGPVPMGVTEIALAIGIDKMETRRDGEVRLENKRRRKMNRRLERLSEAFGVESVQQSRGRMWRRSAALMGAGEATGATGFCAAAQKYSYANEGDALIVKDLVRGAIGHGRKRPVRAYECPLCDGWHLTSQGRIGHGAD
jgi:hypothetical protein